ncbi:hypothetical protein QFC19_006269 [Naganishia cerealis]|uniref:Uncharacterized protein n=1 Tax=Naganishia cerealis TaxID=610337 RepID=A0ACC2VJR9_9TREE|nr:hypothetical protein QFC19_006269 [Naganishia cerealis]
MRATWRQRRLRHLDRDDTVDMLLNGDFARNPANIRAALLRPRPPLDRQQQDLLRAELIEHFVGQQEEPEDAGIEEDQWVDEEDWADKTANADDLPDDDVSNPSEYPRIDATTRNRQTDTSEAYSNDGQADTFAHEGPVPSLLQQLRQQHREHADPNMSFEEFLAHSGSDIIGASGSGASLRPPPSPQRCEEVDENVQSHTFSRTAARQGSFGDRSRDRAQPLSSRNDDTQTPEETPGTQESMDDEYLRYFTEPNVAEDGPEELIERRRGARMDRERLPRALRDGAGLPEAIQRNPRPRRPRDILNDVDLVRAAIDRDEEVEMGPEPDLDDEEADEGGLMIDGDLDGILEVIDGLVALGKITLRQLPSWMMFGISGKAGLSVGANEVAKASTRSYWNSIIPIVDHWRSQAIDTLQATFGATVFGSLALLFGNIGRTYRTFSSKITSFALQDTAYSRAAAISLGLFDIDMVLLIIAALGEQYLGSFGKVVTEHVDQNSVILKLGFFMSVELLLFPLSMGYFLDFCTLPLFPSGTLRYRWIAQCRNPALTAFVHWLAGTMFMDSLSTAPLDLLLLLLWFPESFRQVKWQDQFKAITRFCFKFLSETLRLSSYFRGIKIVEEEQPGKLEMQLLHLHRRFSNMLSKVTKREVDDNFYEGTYMRVPYADQVILLKPRKNVFIPVDHMGIPKKDADKVLWLMQDRAAVKGHRDPRKDYCMESFIVSLLPF